MKKTIEAFRAAVKTKAVQTFSETALALRRCMIAKDPHYPVYHFAGPESWVNDANGVIYHQGKYHLFYQFDPIVDGVRSARCWGHAVSEDLVHWEDWPVALWPDTSYDRNGVFSGNVVIDEDGSAVALYTGHVNGHQEAYGMLARSTDDLLTWRKQMVMHNRQRPNSQSPVHWDAQVWRDSDTWYQLVGGATGEANPQGAAFLWTSPDLQDWTLQKPIARGGPGEFWELPYLIPLGEKYVFTVGVRGNPYWVGTYDREAMRFTPDDPVWGSIDAGDYYAVNPHMVDDKGAGGTARRIMHAWVTSPPSPTEGVPYWQGMHAIPRVITIEEGRLVQQPIPELEVLRGQNQTFGDLIVTPESRGLLDGIRGDALEIIAKFRPCDAGCFGLKVRAAADGETAVPVWYNVQSGEFGVADKRAVSDLMPGEAVQMHVFVDRSVIEVYVNGHAITKVAFVDPAAQNVEVFSCEGTCSVDQIGIWQMGSMWPLLEG